MRAIIGLVVTILIAATVAVAYAQGPGIPLGPGAIFPIGPSTINSSGNSGPPVTACGNGQLDFSLSTGCNVSFYVLGVT